MPSITVDEQKARDILWEETDDFEHIGSAIPGEEHRWYIIYTQIVKEKSSGKLYSLDYNHTIGDTEVEPFYDKELELIEVEPYEVTEIKYRPVK